ncbi:UNVERIFIED_CONTAM: hypothetical protein FKN15_019906 [Acipenser sinensis]
MGLWQAQTDPSMVAVRVHRGAGGQLGLLFLHVAPIWSGAGGSSVLGSRLSPASVHLGTHFIPSDVAHQAGTAMPALHRVCPEPQPGGVPQYNSCRVAVAEAELDVLTGECQVSRVDILFDCRENLNPDIDISHVEGAFVMGLGYWLTEKLIYDSKTGALLSHGTKEYNPSCSKDIPVCFKIELLKDTPNPTGVLRSKANGEPP